MRQPLLQLNQLCVDFAHDGGWLPAVRGVSLALPPASITCLVGESGCGKSLTARAIPGLAPTTARLSGEVMFDGQNLLQMPEADLRRIRGRRIGMVFQEPMTALNPVLRVGLQVAEPLRLHLSMSKAEARRQVENLFVEVGIPSPQSRYDDYPHQLSGGMRQRAMIAMALACAPDLLLADEPTTALDATIQNQILCLLRDQSEKRGMAILLITHDLGVVARMGALVGVMYAGCLVEKAPARQLFADPLHPYTQGLLASMPGPDSARLRRLPAIGGTVPSLQAMPRGCPYQPRCPHALPVCAEALPPPRDDGERMARCWLIRG